MCPVTLTGLAISAGMISAVAAPAALATAATISSVMTVVGVGMALAGGIYSAVSAADTQKKQIQEKYRQQEEKNKLAAEALRRDYEQGNAVKVEEQKKAAAKEEDIQIETMKGQATARVSAGEAGVSGLSIDNLLDGISREGLYDSTTVSTNLAMHVAQIDRNAHNYRLKAEGRQDTSKYFMEDNTGSILSALGGAVSSVGGMGASSSVGSFGAQNYSPVTQAATPFDNFMATVN
jgi:nitrogen fixation/metabolism regulation signal transduction histidine kinase